MRADRPVYIHTNKGMEKLDFLGVLTAGNMDGILKELITNRESGSHGFGQEQSMDMRVDEKIRLAIATFAETRVADFSCDGIPMGDSGERSGRLRIQAHLSSSGLGVTCRILNDYIPELESLGIDPDTTDTLRHGVLKRAGLCLVTGPTGSGKTTTLYAILKRLNTEDVKIITLEDPIEYKLQGVNQSQIDHAKKYDFAGGLRSILRQDPDVVMVGEIRDLETAEIAIQAALTGHLVVSTIHTNSAAGAIPRFLSMGVKPFLLAPAINCIIGQRLVKLLNPEHKVPVTLSESLMTQVRTELSHLHPDILKEYKVDLDHLQFYGPKEGVMNGYKGRVGIYEVFPMTKDIEKLILSGKVSEYDMIEIAQKSGMITMAQDGLLKALDGLTSVEEILRAAELSAVLEEEPEDLGK